MNGIVLSTNFTLKSWEDSAWERLCFRQSLYYSLLLYAGTSFLAQSIASVTDCQKDKVLTVDPDFMVAS